MNFAYINAFGFSPYFLFRQFLVGLPFDLLGPILEVLFLKLWLLS